MVELDQAERGVSAVVEQGGREAVAAGVPAVGGGDGDLAFDDADLDVAHPGQERAVGQPAQDRGFTVRGQSGQEVGAGVGDLF